MSRLTDVVVLGAATMAGAYLLSESVFFEPPRNALQSKLESTDHPAAAWLLEGTSCSTCTGFWVSIFAAVVRRGQYDIVDVLAANGVHMFTQSVEGWLAE